MLPRSAAFVIALVALGFRFREALRTPAWLDEIYVIWVARLEPGALLHLLAMQDLHPPLHFMMVWAWRALGGEAELWLKSLSIGIGLLTLLATFALGRDLFDRATGLLAAALLALHPSAIYFSQEIRSYGLLWLLVVLAAWQAWRWVEEKPGRPGLWFGLVAVAGLYTHYLFGVILICIEFWALACLRRRPARLLRWASLQALVGAAFLPQVPTLLSQLARNQEHWIHPTAVGQLLDLFRLIAFGAAKAAPVIFLLALWPLARARWRGAVALLLALTLPPALLTWYLTRHGAHLFTERYMVYTVPAFCVLTAAGALSVPWPRLRPWLAGALLLFGLQRAVVAPPLPEAASLGRAAAWLAPQLRPGDQVFCADSHSLLFLRHHLPGRARFQLLLTGDYFPYYEMSLVIPDAWRVTPDSLIAAGARGDRWWGVRTRHGGWPSEEAGRLLARAAGDSPALADDPVTVWRGK